MQQYNGSNSQNLVNSDGSNNFWDYLVKKTNIIESDKVVFTMITLTNGKMIYEWFSKETPSYALYDFIKIFLTSQELKESFDVDNKPKFTLKTKINKQNRTYYYDNTHKLGELFKTPTTNGRIYAIFKMEMLNLM